MGRVANLGVEPEFDGSRDEIDIIKLRFVNEDDLHRGDLMAFLRDHAKSIKHKQDDDRPLFRQKQLATSD